MHNAVTEYAAAERDLKGREAQYMNSTSHCLMNIVDSHIATANDKYVAAQKAYLLAYR